MSILSPLPRWHSNILQVLLFLLSLAIVTESDEANHDSPGAFYGLRLLGGICDDQVLQRAADDCAAVTVQGQAFPYQDNTLQWRVLKRRQVLNGFGWQQSPILHNGTWQTTIEKLPVSEPYTIEFQLKDSVRNELAFIKIDHL